MILQDQNRVKIFSRRTSLLLGGKALLLSFLAGRMYYLQVIQAKRFELIADENRIDIQPLVPMRGKILDRFGIPLANNEQSFHLYVVDNKDGNVENLLDSIKNIVVLTPTERDRIKNIIGNQRKGFAPVLVKENLDWEQVAKIEVNSFDLPAFRIETGQIRKYFYGGATAHILGYVGPVSKEEKERDTDPLVSIPDFRIGKSGLEKQLDPQLRGSAGKSEREINAHGRVIRELSREEGQTGHDVIVTLDAKLQEYTQQRLAAEESASAVVLDVHTGDILALGSTPTFDPITFSKGISSKEWKELYSNMYRPLINKAIAGQYAPGSTFKIIVAMAAMEMGISSNKTVFCGGQTSMGRVLFHCWKRGGHGTLNMVGGLMNSCDLYFYEMAKQIGIDAIAATARKFGLGSKLGIELPGEKSGLIPDRAWKKSVLKEAWQPGENLVAGIGQGFITTTPLQLAIMTARMCNGGYAIKPNIIRRNTVAEDPRNLTPALKMDINPNFTKVVLEGMNQVTNVQGGTAYRSRITIPGMEMAGKTGTAQVRRITMTERAAGVTKNEDLPWERRDHALFIGYAPVHNPQYAAAIVVEHGGGGSAIAAPICRDILIEAQTRDSIHGLAVKSS
ncbi:MAG: penicillin-binding protein 2 [Alphaproteobacteria bacterium]|nr:penicillin-binding protein 2 [Alphaproteobacteria bacterium]